MSACPLPVSDLCGSLRAAVVSYKLRGVVYHGVAPSYLDRLSDHLGGAVYHLGLVADGFVQIGYDVVFFGRWFAPD